MGTRKGIAASIPILLEIGAVQLRQKMILDIRIAAEEPIVYIVASASGSDRHGENAYEKNSQ